MCDISLDDFLPALKFVLDWFVTSKMITKFHTTLYADDNTLDFNEDSGNAVYFRNAMGIVSTDLNNINLIILTMIKMILKLLFTSYFWHGIVNLKNTKHLKKS